MPRKKNKRTIMEMKKTWVLALALASTLAAAGGQNNYSAETVKKVEQIVSATLPQNLRIGSVKVKQMSDSAGKVWVNLAENYSHASFAPTDVSSIESQVKSMLGTKNKVVLLINGAKATDYFFGYDKKYARRHAPFVTEVDAYKHCKSGLDGNIVALWQSHGRYYDAGLNRWEWQRPRLFQTVEDLYPTSYVLPFLMPMLENAGAYVWNPRERDTHTAEVIVDNDGFLAQKGYYERQGAKPWTDGGKGFAYKQKVYKDYDNPFADGTYRKAATTDNQSKASWANWSADIPEDGEYAVYVSYRTLPNSCEDATYTVYYDGDKRTFKVNQKMAGGVWVYLGTFPLKKGMNEHVVTLSNYSKQKNRVVTADAVKIGGGMGNVARRPAANTPEARKKSKGLGWWCSLAKDGVNYEYVTSGYPRFAEGSRYFLQWSGFPDSVYSVTHGLSDYADDFRSRSEWVNYLAGGSQALPQRKGLGVPLDLSFAFHTDAGVTPDERIFGTQGIYRCNDFSKYADGTPRIISRDLCELVTDQIVNDLRAQFEPNWTSRGMTQENLYEIRVPEIPGMLMELLSHQNFADMRYGLDPNFRFAVSRAMYKGILKFIAKRDHRAYVVQPLAVNSFAITPTANAGKFVLSWKPTADSLETTAVAKEYEVQERIGGKGAFVRIAVVKDTKLEVEVNDNKLHSYRVVAMNEGGRSFPSETLSLGVAQQSKGTVMVVNGFTRVSAPDWIDEGHYAGFTDEIDHGVPFGQEVNYVGAQYELDRNNKWRGDDSGGWGASRGDYEGKVIVGNTFDYPRVHGKSIMKAGYSFVSASAKAVDDGVVALDPKAYVAVDMLFGKQKEVKNGRGYYPNRYKTFTPGLIKAVEQYCNGGGNVMVTGSYVATDIWKKADAKQEEKDFAQKVLGYKWGSDRISKTGRVFINPTAISQFAATENLTFNNELNDKCYCVESPDAIYRGNDNSTIIMRYEENNKSAAIACRQNGYKTVVMGFPFETVNGAETRDALMAKILGFFAKAK